MYRILMLGQVTTTAPAHNLYRLDRLYTDSTDRLYRQIGRLRQRDRQIDRQTGFLKILLSIKETA